MILGIYTNEFWRPIPSSLLNTYEVHSEIHCSVDLLIYNHYFLRLKDRTTLPPFQLVPRLDFISLTDAVRDSLCDSVLKSGVFISTPRLFIKDRENYSDKR